ncbi:MAG: hypothetical protein WBE22_11990 [Halobacteriota archaeon]
MDEVISDKTEEISQGEQGTDDAGMSKIDKWVEDNTAGKPEDPNDASQVIIDGWTPPMTFNPTDYITPDGDCSVLEKATRYWGWEYVRDLFPESKANDKLMGNHKGFRGQKPQMYLGIMSDGNRREQLIVVNQAFLDMAGNKFGYFSPRTPLEAKNLDDFEWNHDTELTEPGLTDGYDKLYSDTGIYYARFPVATRENEILEGSPNKEIGMHIKKRA